VIVSVLIVLLVLAAGYFVVRNYEVSRNINLVSCKQDKDATPIISSISKNPLSIGDNITITGCNLSVFEGNKNIWVESSSGEKGILYGIRDADYENIKIY